ncbi:MAG: sigma-70 family RNA polymerase sigma factor [Demequina sp.]|nr:sigma-70 family RNA polymerase sigma factor [Demequina sp.]
MGHWQAVAEELLRTRYGALVAHAAFVSGSREGAEDLVHDAFVATFSRVRPFPNATAAEGYVRRAIVTKYLDRTKAQARQRQAALRAAAQPTEMPDAAVGLGGDVTDVLAGLSPRERACVTLRYIDQLSTAETAHALGIAEGSVKRYLADASRKIADLVATEGGVL